MDEEVSNAQRTQYSNYIVESGTSTWLQNINEGFTKQQLLLDDITQRLIILEANVSFIISQQQQDYLSTTNNTLAAASKQQLTTKACKRQFKM